MDTQPTPVGVGAAAEAEAALPRVPGATLAPSTTVSDVDSLSLRMLQRSLATEGDSKVCDSLRYRTVIVLRGRIVWLMFCASKKVSDSFVSLPFSLPPPPSWLLRKGWHHVRVLSQVTLGVLCLSVGDTRGLSIRSGYRTSA